MTNSRFSKSRRFRILTRRCNTRMRALRGGTRADKGGRPANATGGGAGVFKVVDSAIAERHDKIEVRMSAAVERSSSMVSESLVCAPISLAKQLQSARRGVVLACGGFESAPDLHEQYWRGPCSVVGLSR